MNFSGISMLDIYGIERVELEGDYSEITLADALIEEWIPYFECHKCGRWSYCKYAQKHPANPNRSIDIKCGVAIDCIRNLILSVFPTLHELSKEELQSFIDGVYYFYSFVYSSEQYIGMNMESSFHNYWDEFAPYIFSNVGRLKTHLDNLIFHWKEIPGFKASSSVLFVEGYSEKAFLDEMRKSHFSWFLDLNVEVYSGKGNRKAKRIQMLLDKYKSQGLVVFAQGDADGEQADIFRGIIRTGSIDEEHTFVFEHDFESSLPLSLLYETLKELGYLLEITEKDFVEKLHDNGTSILVQLKDSCDIDITSDKIEFAQVVAYLLSQEAWWHDEEFMENTELGRFLRFIQRII